MADVSMPRLSDSMEEGTILKWLRSDGDEISKGDELVEIETDKANMTYESDVAGVLTIVAEEGKTLPVGEVIARVGAGGDGAAPAEAKADGEEQPAEAEEEERAPEPVASGNGASASGDDRIKASPVARRMARELGLSLEGLQGSGPGGRIVKADVEAAAQEGPPAAVGEQPAADGKGDVPAPVVPAATSGGMAKGGVEVRELTRLQQTVARRMAESKATAPDFVLTTEVEMDAAVDLRRQLKALAGDDPAPSFNDLVVKASALALRDFPRANGAYRDGRFERYSRVNVGIAVAGQDALVVPTLFDADHKSLRELARESRAVTKRVRTGAITPPELSGATFTVSNLGMYGIKRFVAVINPPQAAILAVGEMAPRAVVRDGELAVRTTLELTLTCDHRILYGADAAQFLSRIRERLEQPLLLAL